MFLEQVILKHNAHAKTLTVKEAPEGVDFTFNHKSAALQMCDFIKVSEIIKKISVSYNMQS